MGQQLRIIMIYTYGTADENNNDILMGLQMSIIITCGTAADNSIFFLWDDEYFFF